MYRQTQLLAALPIRGAFIFTDSIGEHLVFGKFIFAFFGPLKLRIIRMGFVFVDSERVPSLVDRQHYHGGVLDLRVYVVWFPHYHRFTEPNNLRKIKSKI